MNFTLPIAGAQGRGGAGATFALRYNSQNWRKDPGGIWHYGRNTGYGYGWRLSAGSITPVYRDWWDLAFYIYMDSTGGGVPAGSVERDVANLELEGIVPDV